ncbi:F0F1 ATP synthase subunit A [Mycoplasmopsis californica]|uniref:F0F1 ATP synthase subunit A n=1 Tax=Mycoplasmopsis equigenitalium TaxID=114883 RepID=A0ABY5J243_9BACT|nr:F0F1 ATP synthase subunit A [Mycoplasmopsis equigenitalium]UUD37294.1 F0F1 ATP synthase subunit A [Mycoplasmopsis equigenitalium]VEU69396.1 F0F1 ATP synthase subunit A [Mycoplasmopsis californica]
MSKDLLELKLRDVDYPMIVTLCFIVIAAIAISLVVFFKVRNIKPHEAPKGVALIAEQYFVVVSNTYDDVSHKKIPKLAPYIFSLATFLLLGNIVGLIGLEAVSTSYTIPLFLAFISWFGIYVIGLLFQKWRFFKRYLNPTQIIGDFAPLITLSFRMFGNIIGGSTILLLFYSFIGWITSLIPGLNSTPYLRYILAPVFTSILHLYFDLFGAIIQTYVFVMITAISWATEAQSVEKKIKQKKAVAVSKKAAAAIY